MAEIDYPAIEALIPHRENMCLLKRVVRYADKEIELETEIEAGAWYLDDQGKMPTWVTLEMMAQAAAAYSGMERFLADQGGNAAPRIGVLLGTRALVAHQPTVEVGSRLRIKAAQTFRDESGMGAIEALTYLCGDTGEIALASATLKVYELPTGMTLDDLNTSG